MAPWCVLVGVVAFWRPATGQQADWIVEPERATIGDTMVIERIVAAPVGWRVRPGRLEPIDAVEALADPLVEPHRDGWQVRYRIVAWVPGEHALRLPPLWLLGPDGRADSLPGGTALLRLRSVLPDTATAPQPALQPFRLGRRNALPLGAAFLIAGVSLLGGIWLRRRGPRVIPFPPPPPEDPEVPDARWLAAGETRAVAARAGARLRSAIAQAVPEAHEGLSTTECLLVLEQSRPGTPVAELRDLLDELTETSFALGPVRHGGELAQRTDALIRELIP
jgi:hypothetical protein